MGEVHKRKRMEIQGLRALAVTLAVAFHYFPTVVTGGFVGVDVFFVISGFLITALLLRELSSRGTISLPSFYGRRIRRLLPAATTVILATIAVAAVLVGPLRLLGVLQDAVWVSLYAGNVKFGLDPDGYFADASPSPLLHFWSLAIEEQFYLVWPLLLLAAGAAARRFKFASHGTWIGTSIAVVILGSLAASIWLTCTGSAWAYYSLGTRAWELGVGAGLAWLIARSSWIPRRSTTGVASFVGIAAVLGAGVTFTEATPFPGYAALMPTLGTALVIWATSYHPNLVTRGLSVRGLTYLGDISYSLYLWHLPVLVLGAELVGGSSVARAGLLALSLMLAAASYRFVEQRGQRVLPSLTGGRLIATAMPLVFLFALVPGVASMLIPTSGGPAVAAPRNPVGVVSSEHEVVLDSEGLNPPAWVPANAKPPLAELHEDLADIFDNGCYSGSMNVCEGGDPEGSVRIVLAGDSHAGHWWPAIDAAAKANGWRLFIVGRNGCPLADVAINRGETALPFPECTEWQRKAMNELVNLDADLVVYANNSDAYARKQSLQGRFPETWAKGVTAALSPLDAKVLYLGQFPLLAVEPGACLTDHVREIDRCETPAAVAVNGEVDELNRDIAKSLGATFFDPMQLLCTDVCPIMDGNLVIYRDRGHLTATYATELAGAVGEVINAVLVP